MMRRARRPRRLDREAGESDDLELAALAAPAASLRRLADHRQPLLDRERPGLVRICADADHQPVAERGGVDDHVEMAVGHRVERAGIEGDAGHAAWRVGYRRRAGARKATTRCAVAPAKRSPTREDLE